MRKLLYISLALMLVTMAMGCGRSVDERLVLADSLMWTAPDSSLAILNAIDRDSLGDDENLAYHALLLTQAQFRCNIPLTSDTLISTAVDYYSDNHNREHYTRALLYKGGAYEDMGNPVEAIKWYKKADDNADTTDYRNLAQINLRMGVLYYDNHIGRNFDMSCFKKSLKYYSILKDKYYIMLCNSYIGNIYRVTNQEKARSHLNRAIKLANEIGDDYEFFEATNAISKSYLQEKKYSEALQYALVCVNGRNDQDIDYLCLYNVSRAYSGLGKTDSALFYLSKTSETDDKQLLLNRYLALCDYYNAKNDYDNFKRYNALYNQLADSLESNDNISRLVTADIESNKNIINSKNLKIIDVQSKWGLSIIIIIIVSCVVVIIMRLSNRLKIKKIQSHFKAQSVESNKKMTEILAELNKNSDALSNTEHDLKVSHNQYAAMRGLLVSHINVMKTLTIASSNEPKKKFEKIFNETVSSYRKDADLYANIKKYIDTHYGNVIQELFDANPSLNDEEKKIIELVSIGFSYIDVAVLFDKTPNAMSTRFSRISRKIGSKEPLTKYIEKLKKKNQIEHLDACIDVDMSKTGTAM